jgi:hypothetical protein
MVSRERALDPKAGTENPRAPSYFSQFFEQQIATMEDGQQIRTLYIDRDPETFGDIARHLQGRNVELGWDGKAHAYVSQVITYLRETARISYGSLRTRNSTAVRGPATRTTT